MWAKFFLLKRKEDLSQDGGKRMALDDVEKLIHEAQKKRGSGAAIQRWFLEEIKKLPYAQMGEVARERMLREVDADENVDLEGQHWDWRGEKLQQRLWNSKPQMDDRIDVDGQRWRGERVQEAWKDDEEAMKGGTFEMCDRCEKRKANWKSHRKYSKAQETGEIDIDELIGVIETQKTK
jgi:hypothetical protein